MTRRPQTVARLTQAIILFTAWFSPFVTVVPVDLCLNDILRLPFLHAVANGGRVRLRALTTSLFHLARLSSAHA
ncbi:MAG: hypothetical protein F6K56_15590 [Moorea sp. SIO3G5]|nr:hypothetical protein [Moorena sp. SIO3G5]